MNISQLSTFRVPPSREQSIQMTISLIEDEIESLEKEINEHGGTKFHFNMLDDWHTSLDKVVRLLGKVRDERRGNRS